MPKNKNFQLRIEILDELLSSKRKRSIAELLDTLNNRLEASGNTAIGKRSLYDDLNYLENEKGAPIKRATKADPLIYYTEPFSIKNIPVPEEDVAYLRQAIEILKKATDLNIINDIENIVVKLENKVHTNIPNSTTMIAFEEHTKALGQEHLDDLFTAIRERCALKVIYKPFKKEARDWIIHPYMLKEYRNRWFLLCRYEGADHLMTLALDRIQKISNCRNEFIDNVLFDPDTYFNNLIGVTLPEASAPETIKIAVSEESADYIITKPLHKSQRVISAAGDPMIIKVELFVNFELKSYLLSYGPRIRVLAPAHLREEMAALYNEGAAHYQIAL
ncbi:Predicted DNA-binding transcriptional regulator YafY, contains an HTH and WYL domains [Cnuella takakiae]|uniref:Predicted DNA-binding transcriptional regulator YafY, contains an HTH and WYL domains n=1 Tax=Cnuella takakiae TaxID=1302690 RepID=A0A1M4TCM2_9BACT|nr:WYL domain-containing protein [Cnuella takakiae]OLY90712.1 hypothetical protein BUE76_01470 [Cnuella takakiae]SHE42289.1 Predicted DNA-binding transcriptional regulator YafY, contains an HTH and WYL domains [Cnuella takakiae]